MFVLCTLSTNLKNVNWGTKKLLVYIGLFTSHLTLLTCTMRPSIYCPCAQGRGKFYQPRFKLKGNFCLLKLILNQNNNLIIIIMIICELIRLGTENICRSEWSSLNQLVGAYNRFMVGSNCTVNFKF